MLEFSKRHYDEHYATHLSETDPRFDHTKTSFEF